MRSIEKENKMRTLTMLATVAFAGTVLTGCVNMEKYEEQRSLKQLDSSTYELELLQPWVDREVIVRENARLQAIDVCGETERGMQPLQAISRSARQTGNGCYVKYTFRCVGLMDAPKREYHRLGFYTDEESKEEATKRYRDEFGF